jgi:hypothetical protein
LAICETGDALPVEACLRRLAGIKARSRVAALVRVLAALVFLLAAYGTSFSAGYVPPRRRAPVGVVVEKVGSADERLA